MSKVFTESVIRVLVFWIVVRVYNKWYQELWFESLKEASFDSMKVVLVFVFLEGAERFYAWATRFDDNKKLLFLVLGQ